MEGNSPERKDENQPSPSQQWSPFTILKKLYSWVLSWAESKYSTMALCILAFVESSFFPVPPDVLQIALSISKPKKSFHYAFLASLFSVLGGITGYFIGFFLFESIGKFIIANLGYEQQFLSVSELFKQNAFLAILAAAFTPIPYKVFTIASCFWQVGLGVLIMASVIGRSGRFFIIGTLTYFFGERVKEFIEKYFNLLSLFLFIFVILGYVAIKYVV